METLKENEIKNALASVAALLLEKKADDDERPNIQFLEDQTRAAQARLGNITKILRQWKQQKNDF